LAIVGLSIAPTVSRGLALQAGHDPWSDICSQHDVRHAGSADDSVSDTTAAPSLGHLEHCPLCTLASHAPALPVSLPVAEPSVDLADSHPVVFRHAPKAPVAWCTAQPRAPPLAS